MVDWEQETIDSIVVTILYMLFCIVYSIVWWLIGLPSPLK